MRFPNSTIETRSLPTLARCYPRSFTFYVAHPVRSIQTLLTSSFLLLTLRGARHEDLSHHGRGWGVGRGLGAGVDLGVAIGVGQGVTVDVAVGLGVGVGLGKHALTTSTKRATTCWLPWSVVCTPVTRKPPSLLLETTEPRAGNWTVPAKTFTASPSSTPSEDRSCNQTVLEFGSVHLTR